MPRLTQWLAATPPAETRCFDAARQVAKREHVRVEGLVGVQVDRRRGATGGLDDDVDRPDTIGLEVRAAPHHTGAETRAVVQRPHVLVRTRTGHRGVHERDELDVHQVAEVRRCFLRGDEVADPGARSRVDVRSHRGDPVEEQLLERGSDAGDHVVVREHPLEFGGDPGVDRPEEVARRVRYLLGGQRLVDVCMRFGHRRQDQPAPDVGRRPRCLRLVRCLFVRHDVGDRAQRDVTTRSTRRPSANRALRYVWCCGGRSGVSAGVTGPIVDTSRRRAT